ncbi:MAG: hypothetical protein ACOH5I_09195 [Oligoflexus sp.]
MLRAFLIIMIFALNLQSCGLKPAADEGGLDAVASATYNPATNQFDVVCQDGSQESVSLADYGNGKACLPKPDNPIHDFFAYDGTYCAQYQNGLLHCWQTDQDIYVSSKLNPPELSKQLTHVDIGRDVACGIDETSGVRCWGLNDKELLNIPANLSQPKSAKAVAVGQNFACAIRSDDSLQCWGDRESSEFLGKHLPVNALAAKDLVVVEENLCLLHVDGEVACYGPDTMKPKYDSNSRAVSIYSNKGQVACTIHEDGSMNCYASQWNQYNEIYSDLPPGSLGELKSIALGEDRACVLRANGLQPFCWGGYTDAAGIFPEKLQTLKKLSIGRFYCGLEESGEFKCWEPGSGFVDLRPSHTARYLSAGQDSVCSITNKGEVTCWGQNRITQDKSGFYNDIFSIDSEIGDNDPFKLSSQAIALGYDHSCFLQQGYLQCAWQCSGLRERS